MLERSRAASPRRAYFGVERATRVWRFEETLTLLRRHWTEDLVMRTIRLLGEKVLPAFR